jgi:hypothetical protein
VPLARTARPEGRGEMVAEAADPERGRELLLQAAAQADHQDMPEAARIARTAADAALAYAA